MESKADKKVGAGGEARRVCAEDEEAVSTGDRVGRGREGGVCGDDFVPCDPTEADIKAMKMHAIEDVSVYSHSGLSSIAKALTLTLYLSFLKEVLKPPLRCTPRCGWV